MIMFRRIKRMRGRKMGREIWVTSGVWRSLGVGIDGAFLLVGTSSRSCVIDFRFSSLVLDI